MKALFDSMLTALRGNTDTVLCSIIASSGSVPRGSGAKMAVFPGGSTAGTIGGGAVEHESVKLAEKALRERAAFTHGFNLTHNDTADIGMICGGQVTVYFQFFAGGDAAAIRLFEAAAALCRARTDSWLITRIDGGGVTSMGVYDAAAGLRFAGDTAEADILPLLKSRAVLQKGDPMYYVEPLGRAGTVYVFGGGHVSQELVPVLAHIGFPVTVFEDRAPFASPALFPAAESVLLGDFTDIAALVDITAADYIVILTRGHMADLEVLAQALRSGAAYIGVIGSRHKIAATNARLAAMGIPEGELGRIHTPIGLPIGAETPAEIAISIAAELIEHRARLAGAKA